VEIRKPRWSSSSFLLYLGAFTVLGAMSSAYAYLAAQYGEFAFVGWTLLMLGVLLVLGGIFRRGSWIAGGLFAWLAVAALGTFVGAVFTWWGWGGAQQSQNPFDGWHWVLWLLIVIVLSALSATLRATRFPLLVLPTCLLAWFLVTDVISGGGSWSAVVTLLFGTILFFAGLGANRVYGFWIHVVSGLLVGGALLYWWHSSTLDFWLLAATGAVFITLGMAIDRSSWTVLGSLGLIGAATHFAIDWSSGGGLFGLPTREWVPIVVAAGLGFLFVVLGLWAGRRPQPAQ
jgi:hypothetical protein